MSFSNSFLLRRFEDLSISADHLRRASAESRGTIVLAESDPSELEHIASILRNLNFDVVTAEDGETALKLVREKSPVLVLSSLVLPGIDGYKLCQCLRENQQTESIPFMFIVDDGEFPDHLIGHESYAHDYIQKPISVSEFKNRIHALVNLASPQDSGDLSVQQSNRSLGFCAAETGQEGRSRALQLCDDLRSLLNDVVSCLGELERLVTADLDGLKEDDGQIGVPSEGMAPRSVEARSGSGSKFSALQADRENRPPMDQDLPTPPGGGSTRTGEELSEGVEDIFAEFFKMESAVRFPREIPEAGRKKDEVSLSSEDLSEPTSEPEETDGNKGLYEKSIAYVLESIRGVVAGEAPDIYGGAKLAELIVESLGLGSSLILAATDREQNYSVSRHSVNVAIFATQVAQTLGRNLQCRREVCLAGLLHELGIGRLPANLVHREDSLNSEEMKLIRRRPLESGEIIEDLGREYGWLARIVEQVTERENGTGSPVGLLAEEIDERAKMIGIADVFDAYIHKRPYRDSISGYQALFELTTDQQRAFSDQIVKALIRSFSLYPLNECVRLSTGEIGKVVDVNPENLSRPVVALLYDKDGGPLSEPRKVDLARESSLYIAEALVGRRCPSAAKNHA